ncbi:hypothetical protein [Geobacter sp.]|uniref:hypothetical protein n=1 Tax=Geobacter sp. TaxID=46610 RepID=UPI00262C65B3|nr:hypothetical protein [Geobacter sp.]
MEMLKISRAVIAISLAVAALQGCATLGVQPRNRAEVVVKTDDTVRLLHIGGREAQADFCLGEIVPVYRWYAGGRYVKYRETGKVKITRYEGEHYLEALLLEGDVKEGDMVRKAGGCLETMK